jgi:hypothetical protein
MTTMLQAVLTAFEEARGPISLNEMARDLGIAPGMLDGLIEHWVRKGKVRACSGGSACASCHSACSYSPTMPRSYELVTGAEGDHRCCGG